LKEISQESPIPLHLQVRQIVMQRINSGDFKNKIPSERELMDRFQISRTTVREAIASLVHDGILEKVHGRGTFVKQTQTIQEWMTTINSFTKTIQDTGLEPSAKLIGSGITSIPIHFQNYLHCQSGYFIERIRFASNKPVAIERHYYHRKVGAQLVNYDLNTIVIYDVLEQDLGFKLWETEETITCKAANEKEAEHLNVPLHSGLLQMDRILYNQAGQPIECLISVYRPDMFAYKIRRTRKGENG